MSTTTRWARVRMGAQASLAVLLAVLAALLAVEVGDWRFVRVDLSLARKNSLDPAVLDVIEKLPEPVKIEVFFRDLPDVYLAVSRQAQAATLEYLRVVSEARRDRLELVVHDLANFEATRERLTELGLEGVNKLVLTCGERKAVLELFGELALVDWGNPSERGARLLWEQGIADAVPARGWNPQAFRAAQFLEFRGEEPFVAALRKVSSGAAPRVYVTRNHGEPALEGNAPEDLGRFAAALRRDGFELVTWDPLATPEVPADCEVLCLLGPAQPFEARTREAIARWIADGGQALVAPSARELDDPPENGLGALLANFGVVLRPGVVCRPVVGLDGLPSEGQPECAGFALDESSMQPGHELTEPMRMRKRQLRFFAAGAFESGGLEGSVGSLLPVVTLADGWRDLGPQHDWRLNPAAGEARRERLALVSIKQLAAAKRADGSVRQGRIVAVGGVAFFANALFDVNRDFALNTVNWLAQRDYRIAVRPLPRGESFLDVQRPAARPLLTYGLGLVLPGLFVLVGVGLFLRRRN